MQTVLRTLALFPGWTEDPAGHLADVERLAADYAKRNGHDAAAVLADLDALAGKIAAAAAELSDVQDMQAFNAATLELDAEAQPAGAENLARKAGDLEHQRQLYAALFDAVCGQLAAAGFTLTAHQIGGHKFNHQQRHSLAKLVTQPGRFTATAEDTATRERLIKNLYEALSQNGYISGPYEAFNYYFGPTVHPEAEKPTSGLIWAKSDALFGVFAFMLADVMRSGRDVNYNTFLAAFPGRNEHTLRSAVSRARCADNKQSKSRRASRGKDELKDCIEQAIKTTLKK